MKTQTNIHEKTKRIVLLAFLAALVVVLQLFCQFVLQANNLPISLVLLPIVVGGILLGPGAGAFLGAVFGIVVFVCCITGLDKTGIILCEINPFTTALVCIGKGLFAGLFSALCYKLISRSSKNISVPSLVASAVAPIVNTGLFILGLLVFFKDTLYSWAGDSNILTFIFIGLVGVNFIIEFLINIIITPLIMPAIAKNFGK